MSLQIQIGSLTLELQFPFFVLLSLFFCLDSQGLSLPVCGALFLHELGHGTAMALLQIPVKEIRLSCFGIELVPGDRQISYRREALVYLAGPLVNLLAAALFLFYNRSSLTGIVHLVLGTFHLLPIGALDGGQLVRALLCSCRRELSVSFWSLLFSAVFLLPLTGLALWLALSPQRNFSLLFTVFYLFLSVFAQDWQRLLERGHPF